MTTTAADSTFLRFTKHHGAGNDFLVLIDPDGSNPLSPDLVRALCDRHFGVGADGVIRVLAGGDRADLVMVLQNADGSEAEMSGNGMRCLAQAAVQSALVAPPTFTVATGGGVRTVAYAQGSDPDTAWATVGMGRAELGENQPQKFGDRKVRTVDMGNPHLVMFGPDLDDLDVAGIGAHLQTVYEGGVNVEFITTGDEPDHLVLRVFERGVGETQACGTGSAAAAAAAHSWGLVGRIVAVHNPGGTLEVNLDDDDEVLLAGPVHRVASVVVSPSGVLAGSRPQMSPTA
jgi:diaminopimelate epimerase